MFMSKKWRKLFYLKFSEQKIKRIFVFHQKNCQNIVCRILVIDCTEWGYILYEAEDKEIKFEGEEKKWRRETAAHTIVKIISQSLGQSEPSRSLVDRRNEIKKDMKERRVLHHDEKKRMLCYTEIYNKVCFI